MAVHCFSVACSTGRDDKKETGWLTVADFGKAAEFCNDYLTKGRQIYVEGNLSTKEFERKDGTKGTSIEVASNRVESLSSRENIAKTTATGPLGDGQPANRRKQTNNGPGFDPFVDDLPAPIEGDLPYWLA
jgi:single-strand DNA-binding protein